MWSRILPLLVVLISISGFSSGKSDPDKLLFKQIRIHHDNDVFSIVDPSDRYYTFGSFLGFYMEVDPEKRFWQGFYAKDRFRKLILGTALIQQGWMPVDNFTSRTDRMDRPYAGYLAVEGSAQIHWEMAMLRSGLQIGGVGNGSGARWFQQGLHDIFGLQPTNGWYAQIPGRFVLQLNLEHTQRIYGWRLFEMQLENFAALGNRAVAGSAGMGFRLGKFAPQWASGWRDARISRRKANRGLEIYMDAFIHAGLRAWDLTYQGHRNESWAGLYETIRPFIWGWHIGFHLSKKRFSLEYYVQRQSKESDRTKIHDWGGIALHLRL